MRTWRAAVTGRVRHPGRGFTQGLIEQDGTVWESTGLYGASALSRYRLGDERPERSAALPADLFGEGICRAGDAWRMCREGRAEPDSFGLKLMNEGGAWWIAANLLRDVAALANMEMLPWDIWGAMPAPDETIGEDLIALFDRLATLTHDPDALAAELAAAYAGDPRVYVPATVYNAILDRTEPVLA